MAGYTPSFRVLDGDTIEDLNSGERIRLNRINTPEIDHGRGDGQLLGEEARQFTEQFVRGGATVDPTGTDGYGRTLAEVSDPDQRDLESALVREGLATAQFGQDENLAFEQFAGGRDAEQGILPGTAAERARNAAIIEAGIHDESNYNQNRHGTFEKAFARGGNQMQGMYYGMAKSVADLTGFDMLSEWGEEGIRRNFKEAALNPAEIQSWDDVDDLDSAFTFFVEALGEQAPQLMGDLAMAATGAGVGAVAARRTAQRQFTKSLLRRMPVEQRELLKKRIRELPMATAKAGALANIYAQSAGETATELQQAGVEDTSAALLTGVPKTALEYAPMDMLVRGAARSLRRTPEDIRSAFTDVAQRVGMQTVVEGGTEGLQTIMDFITVSAHTGQDLFDPERISELKTAIAKGAAVGGGLSTAANLPTGYQAVRNRYFRRAEEDGRFEEQPEVVEARNSFTPREIPEQGELDLRALPEGQLDMFEHSVNNTFAPAVPQDAPAEPTATALEVNLAQGDLFVEEARKAAAVQSGGNQLGLNLDEPVNAPAPQAEEVLSLEAPLPTAPTATELVPEQVEAIDVPPAPAPVASEVEEINAITTAEPVGDLRAQYREFNRGRKNAFFVSRANPDVLARVQAVAHPEDVQLLETAEGVLLVRGEFDGQTYRDAPPSQRDDMRARVLGYAQSKSELADPANTAVVQTRDDEGNIITAEVVDADRAAAVAEQQEAATQPGEVVEVTDPLSAQAERQQRVEDERRLSGIERAGTGELQASRGDGREGGDQAADATGVPGASGSQPEAIDGRRPASAGTAQGVNRPIIPPSHDLFGERVDWRTLNPAEEPQSAPTAAKDSQQRELFDDGEDYASVTAKFNPLGVADARVRSPDETITDEQAQEFEYAAGFSLVDIEQNDPDEKADDAARRQPPLFGKRLADAIASLQAQFPTREFVPVATGQRSERGKPTFRLEARPLTYPSLREAQAQIDTLSAQYPDSEFFAEADDDGQFVVRRFQRPEQVNPDVFGTESGLNAMLPKMMDNATKARNAARKGRKDESNKVLQFRDSGSGETIWMHTPTIAEYGMRLAMDNDQTSSPESYSQYFLAGMAELYVRGLEPVNMGRTTIDPVTAEPLTQDAFNLANLNPELVISNTEKPIRVKDVLKTRKEAQHGQQGLTRLERQRAKLSAQLNKLYGWRSQAPSEKAKARYTEQISNLERQLEAIDQRLEAGYDYVSERTGRPSRDVTYFDDKTDVAEISGESGVENYNPDRERKLDREVADPMTRPNIPKRAGSMTLAQAQRAVARFQQQYPGLAHLDIEVYSDYQEAGLNFDDGRAAHYVPGENRIQVFAERMPAAEIESALKHEAFAHFQLDTMAPEARARFFRDLRKALASDPELQTYHRDHVAPAYGTELTDANLEEVLARVAESDSPMPFSQRVLSWLRAQLRKLGFSINLTRNDLRYMVERFARDMAEGKYRPQGNGEGRAPLPFAPNALAEAIRNELRPGIANRMWERTKNFYNGTIKAVPVLFTADRQLRVMGAAGKRLANAFFHQAGDRVRSPAFFHRREVARAQWLEQVRRLKEDVFGGDTERYMAALEELQGSDTTEEAANNLSDDARLINEWMHHFRDEYLKPRMRTIGRLPVYFPRMYNIERLESDPEAFYDALESTGAFRRDEAQSIRQAILNGAGGYEFALPEFTHATGPGMDSRSQRQLTQPEVAAALRDGGFLFSDPEQVLEHYIYSATARAEFEGMFHDYLPITGWDPNPESDGGLRESPNNKDILRAKLIQAGRGDLTSDDFNTMAQRAIEYGYLRPDGDFAFWYSPSAKIERMIGELDSHANQTRARVILDGYMGRLGADMPPVARKAFSYAQVFESTLTLLFSAVASLPDLAGPIFRARDLDEMWANMKTAVRVIRNYGDAREFARDMGVVNQRMTHHALKEMYGQAYASAGAQKVTETLFKLNGQEMLTNFTRTLAAAMGERFIVSSARKANRGDVRAQRYLDELGITAEQVLNWEALGSPAWSPDQNQDMQALTNAMQSAIIKYTDESIVRPNAAQRPVWASNPWYMLFWQLKSFFYSYGKVVLGGIAREVGNRYGERGGSTAAKLTDAALPALAAGTLLLPLAALGLELREEIQYEEEDEPTNRLDGWQYTKQLVSRAGIYGPLELALGTTRFDSADSAAASVAGPAIQHVHQLLTGEETYPKIKRSLPVFNQVPWLSDWLENELAL